MQIGLIGYGGIGRRHARHSAANPALKLVAVCDPDPQARERARQEHGVTAFETAEAMLDGISLDGVLVTAPTAFHGEYIELAARAGKHVFSEKPLVLRPEEAAPVRATLEATGITFGFGLVLRYMAAYMRAREMVRTGELGRVMLAHARYGAMFPEHRYVYSPDLGGGLLNEHTIHMLDTIDDLVGPVRTVSACLGRVQGRETEDTAAILLQCEGGVGATLAGSGMTHFPSTLEITGTRREIAVVENARLEEIEGPGRRELPLDPAPDPYLAEVEEWRRAVVEGRAPRTGLPEALRITALLAAVHDAARTGQTILVGEV
jgi:predicted dehydrogenase